MDSTTLLVVVVVLLAVVLVVLYLFRRGSVTQPGASTFVFTPPDEIGVTPLVKRRVTIVAPDQIVAGRPRKLIVEALPLPPDPISPPPKGKGIDRLITSVIHPRVQYADVLETVTNFDPPLTLTINYLSEDAAAAGQIEGKPRISIVTFYQDGEVWRWERLGTDVDVVAMTCTANLKTLRPQDPAGMGIP